MCIFELKPPMWGIWGIIWWGDGDLMWALCNPGEKALPCVGLQLGAVAIIFLWTWWLYCCSLCRKLWPKFCRDHILRYFRDFKVGSRAEAFSGELSLSVTCFLSENCDSFPNIFVFHAELCSALYYSFVWSSKWFFPTLLHWLRPQPPGPPPTYMVLTW